MPTTPPEGNCTVQGDDASCIHEEGLTPAEDHLCSPRLAGGGEMDSQRKTSGGRDDVREGLLPGSYLLINLLPPTPFPYPNPGAV